MHTAALEVWMSCRLYVWLRIEAEGEGEGQGEGEGKREREREGKLASSLDA